MTRPDDIHDVLDQLASLTPTADDAPRPAGQALAQLKVRINANIPSRQDNLLWRITAMLTRKRAFAMISLVVLLLVAFSLPPVRAAASDFLGLFRVQKFAAISISPQQMALLERMAEEGLYPGEVEMIEDPGGPQKVASLEEAAAQTGRGVATIPDLGAPAEIQVMQGGSGRLHVDLENARAILEAADVDPKALPDSLDGAAVDVTIYPSVEQYWENSNLLLMQTQSPLVDYPDDVNVTVLGQALLELLGMAPGEARRLATSIDWTNTLIMPIPENLATFQEVQVNGTSGLALSSVDGAGNSLIWQEGGSVYLLAGDATVGALVAAAEGMQ